MALILSALNSKLTKSTSYNNWLLITDAIYGLMEYNPDYVQAGITANYKIIITSDDVEYVRRQLYIYMINKIGSKTNCWLLMYKINKCDMSFVSYNALDKSIITSINFRFKLCTFVTHLCEFISDTMSNPLYLMFESNFDFVFEYQQYYDKLSKYDWSTLCSEYLTHYGVKPYFIFFKHRRTINELMTKCKTDLLNNLIRHIDPG